MLVSVGLSSIQLLSRGRILKTEQNSTIVTVERRIDTYACITDSVAAFSSCLKRYSDFKYKIRSNINMASCWLDVRPQLLSTEHDCRHTTGVVSCCKQSVTVGTCC